MTTRRQLISWAALLLCGGAAKAEGVPPESPSSLAEFGALLRPTPKIDLQALAGTLPRGDGHAVLVLPASLCGDSHTDTLRDLLARLGYRPFGWDLGTNWGPTPSLVSGAAAKVQELSAVYGKITVIGFSMGGLFARLLGKRQPDHVRDVITVCSPFADPMNGARIPIVGLVRFEAGRDLPRLIADLKQPLTIPGTFLYSREDGIVVWQDCIDPHAAAGSNIAFKGCHITAAHNPEVLAIIGRRLAGSA